MEDNLKPQYQPWNEDAFQADVFVRGMTWLQRLLYRSLLCAAFFHNTRPYLPTDDDVLWVLAGAENLEMWLQNKTVIMKRFTVCSHDPNLLEQNRVLKDWNRVQDALTASREYGRNGGLKSAASRGGQGGVRKTLVSELGGVNQLNVTNVTEPTKLNQPTNETELSVSVSSHRSADWKNIALRHKRYFGKKAGIFFKDKYFDACSKYGEEIVLELFDEYGPTNADWVESNNVQQPLHKFFKNLAAEAADAVDLNIAEKEEQTAVAEQQKRSEQIQAESIERQTAEINAILSATSLDPETECKLEDIMAEE